MAIIIGKRINLDAPIKVESLNGVTFTTETEAHQFVVRCEQKGQELTLSGTISAKFVRADGNTVQLVGSISDGAAVVTLTQDCYNVQGRFQLAIFNTVGDTKLCIYACVGTVQKAQSGNLIDGGDIIPDVEDLIADIQAAVQSIPPTYDALLVSIAGTYSASKTYAVGDYVWYDGSLYRCTTAITTAEAWTSAHWTAAVLGDDVSAIKSALNDTDNALNEYVQNIKYADVSDLANGYIDYRGAPVSSNEWRHTDYIRVQPGYVIYYELRANQGVSSIAFYNINQEYVSGIVASGEISGNFSGQATVPNGVAYAVFSFRYNSGFEIDKSQYIKYFGNVFADITSLKGKYDDFYDVLNGYMLSIKYSDISDLTNGYIDRTGVPNSDDGWKRTDFIAIPHNCKITYELRANTVISSIAFYDSDQEYMSGIIASSTSGNFSGQVNAPDGAMYAIFSFRYNSGTATDKNQHVECAGVVISDVVNLDAKIKSLGNEILTDHNYIDKIQSQCTIKRNFDGYAYYTFKAESTNACVTYYKKPLLFYNAEAEGAMLSINGTKAFDLLSAVSTATVDGFPDTVQIIKIGIIIRGTDIRVAYRDGNNLRIIDTISYTIGNVVKAQIIRNNTQYDIFVDYNNVLHHYVVPETSITTGRSCDYVCFGSAQSTGISGKMKIRYQVTPLKIDSMGGDAPIAYSCQKEGETEDEKALYPFAYKCLSRAFVPANAIVPKDHYNPGGGYISLGSWTWDSFFNSIAACAMGGEAIETAKQNYLLHEMKINANETFPRAVTPDGVGSSDQQPWIAQWALMLSKTTRDYAWFDYNKLKQHITGIETTRKDANGLFLIRAGFESGLDNSAAVCYPETEEQMRLTTMKYESVMQSSLMVNEYKAMAELAIRCNDIENRQMYIDKATELQTAINNLLWDSDDGVYYCRHIETETFNKVKHIENIAFALYAGVPTTEMAEALYDEVNSSNYLAEYGVYTVNKTDVAFHNDNVSGYTRVNWNGPCWLPTSYCLAVGLWRYGYKDLAESIIAKMKKAALYYMQTNPYYAMPEYYNPDDLTPYGYMDYTWGPCIVFFDEQSRKNNLPVF